MNIVNRKLNLEEFEGYVSAMNFSPNNPNKVIVHHSFSPTQKQWKGEATMVGLKKIYEGKGWPSGPHLFIEENGIWLFSPMNQTGTHAKAGNTRSIGIEVVGDYTNVKWPEKTKENVLGAIKILLKKLNLNEDNIHVHREYSQTACPGNAITRDWIIQECKNLNTMKKYEAPEWAEKGVEFVTNSLVDGVPLMEEIRNEQDARLSVILERFYKLIRS